MRGRGQGHERQGEEGVGGEGGGRRAGLLGRMCGEALRGSGGGVRGCGQGHERQGREARWGGEGVEDNRAEEMCGKVWRDTQGL